MPTWVKVVLIIVLVGFVLLVGGVIVAARWVRSKGETLKEQGKVLVSEAQEFGRGKDEEACLAESLRRLRSCPGFICEAKLKVFLTTCLETADKKPENCAGVPSPNELIEGARWQMAECKRRGWPNDQRCMRLVSTLQLHCAE